MRDTLMKNLKEIYGGYLCCPAKLINNQELEIKQLVMKAWKSMLHKHGDIGDEVHSSMELII